MEFWSELPEDKDADELEDEGYILIDLGNGKFDHHRLGPENKEISSSHLVASYLEIDDRPDLQKLLELARRDDLEGKGTLSSDQIDRAFGFSGLLTSLNKTWPDNPKHILEIAVSLIQAHFIQENRKYEHMPEQFQKLLSEGKVKEFKATHFNRQVKVIYVESDDIAIAGYLRSRAIGADLVIQKSSTGHVNFVSQQRKRLVLKKLARLVKLMEAEKNGLVLHVDSMEDLELPGRTNGLPHWYYDTRANTLQNGGVNPQGIPSTKLTYQEIETLVKQGLNIERILQGRFDSRHRIVRGRGADYIE